MGEILETENEFEIENNDDVMEGGDISPGLDLDIVIDTSETNDISELVRRRLLTFGYKTAGNDDIIIRFIIERVQTYIKSTCNIADVPDELTNVLVDMVAGNFLKEKKQTSSEPIMGLDLTLAVQSIKEGDTNVTFAIGNGNTTPEQRFDAIVNHLIGYGEKILVSYRCLSW